MEAKAAKSKHRKKTFENSTKALTINIIPPSLTGTVLSTPSWNESIDIKKAEPIVKTAIQEGSLGSLVNLNLLPPKNQGTLV